MNRNNSREDTQAQEHNSHTHSQSLPTYQHRTPPPSAPRPAPPAEGTVASTCCATDHTDYFHFFFNLEKWVFFPQGPNSHSYQNLESCWNTRMKAVRMSACLVISMSSSARKNGRICPISSRRRPQQHRPSPGLFAKLWVLLASTGVVVKALTASLEGT